MGTSSVRAASSPALNGQQTSCLHQAELVVDFGLGPKAQQIRQWLAQHALHERDAVVLLPFAALLPPLRQAFARAGRWQVRVETTRTLGASLALPKDPLPGRCCGDPVLDHLNAGLLLRSERSAADIAQHDPLAFAHLATLVVDAAQAQMAAAAGLPPGEREAFWTQARAGVAQTLGGRAAAALESRLLGLALEWAAASCQGSAAHSDRLHAMQPSAWLVVRLGGVDSVADAVARASSCPALWLDLDPPLDWQVDAPSAAVAGLCGALQSARWVCDDFEAEAQAAAALVVDAVNDGRVPVALVAVDRALTRRVRALLATTATGCTRSCTTFTANAIAASLLRRSCRRLPLGRRASWRWTKPSCCPGAPASSYRRSRLRRGLGRLVHAQGHAASAPGHEGGLQPGRRRAARAVADAPAAQRSCRPRRDAAPGASAAGRIRSAQA